MAAGIALSVSLAAGCQTRPPIAVAEPGDPAQRFAITEHLPVGDPGAWPCGMQCPEQMQFIAAAPDSGELLQVSRDGGATRWTMRRRGSRSTTGPWTPLSDQTWVRDQAGSVALAEEVNYVEAVEVVFDPPMVTLPVDLGADEPFVQDLTMTVYPMGDRSRVRSSGRLRQTVTLEGRCRVAVPAGGFEATRVRQEFVAALKPAEVTNLTESWMVEGLGRVAEFRVETTRVLGVQIRSNREDWVLAAKPAEGDSTP